MAAVDSTAYYNHPARNNTVYSGTAITVQGRVTASSAGSYNYELKHQLKHAKFTYVGGFVDGVPVAAPGEGSSRGGYSGEGPEGSYYNDDLPFVTGGLLTVTVKK